LAPRFDPTADVLLFRAQPIAGLTAQSKALSINDNNDIVGYDSSGSNGAPQVFYAPVGEKAQRIDRPGGAARLFRLDVTLVNATAVPEPPTWMVLIAGVGLVSWTARQRLRALSLVGTR
jgi:hypothetical protein